MARSFTQLPVSSSHGGRRVVNGRRGIIPAREKWIHAIPVIVFICFFILWRFSQSVNIAIENGEIVATQRLDKSIAVSAATNESRVTMAILSSAAASPSTDSVSVSHNLTLSNATAPVQTGNLTTRRLGEDSSVHIFLALQD